MVSSLNLQPTSTELRILCTPGPCTKRCRAATALPCTSSGYMSEDEVRRHDDGFSHAPHPSWACHRTDPAAMRVRRHAGGPDAPRRHYAARHKEHTECTAADQHCRLPKPHPAPIRFASLHDCPPHLHPTVSERQVPFPSGRVHTHGKRLRAARRGHRRAHYYLRVSSLCDNPRARGCRHHVSALQRRLSADVRSASGSDHPAAPRARKYEQRGRMLSHETYVRSCAEAAMTSAVPAHVLYWTREGDLF